MSILKWILEIFSLVPTIATGVHTVMADVDLGSKQQAASDALTTAGTSTIALLPVQDQATATAILGTAQTALSSTVAALHAGNTPAPVVG